MALSKITNASVADTAVHGRRNLIINGAMQVAQRGTSTTGVTGQGYHAVDRFDQNITTMGAYTISQSTTAPTDFTTSLKMDVTTADASPASGDVVAIRTKLEGLNLQQLNFGSSDAKSITLSFYVKSNKTGTYVVSSYLADAAKQWGKTYTIASADTWERKTITWQGSSNSSVINNDSGSGIIFTWYLGAGTGRTSGSAQIDWTAYATADEAVGQTVNIADSTANEFLITGVQLEVGEQATPFEHRSYGDELAACQRYYTEIQKASGQVISGTTSVFCGVFPTEMRTTPSASLSGALTIWQLGIAGSKGQSSSNISVNSSINSASVFNAECANFTGMTLNYATAVAGGDQPLKFDAEL